MVSLCYLQSRFKWSVLQASNPAEAEINRVPHGPYLCFAVISRAAPQHSGRARGAGASPAPMTSTSRASAAQRWAKRPSKEPGASEHVEELAFQGLPRAEVEGR